LASKVFKESESITILSKKPLLMSRKTGKIAIGLSVKSIRLWLIK
jgi:hypothetical protein